MFCGFFFRGLARLHRMETHVPPQTLETLIAFRTVAGNRTQKDACLDWIHRNFVAESKISPVLRECADCPYLLMNHPKASWLWFAHVDVVPGRVDQFHMARDGDRITGRGVKDMKGAALPFLLAYRDACLEGQIPRVSILISTDEETGGKTIPNLLKEGCMTPIAFTPDTGSSPGIVTEHKGAVWFTLASEGISGHGAIPWESKSPIPALADALLAISQAYPPGTESDWKMTVSVTELSGSDAVNRIPKLATATLDVRYPPEKYRGPEEVKRELQTLLPRGCTLSIKECGNPLKTDPKHPFIQNFVKVVERVEGEKPGFIREHGATDARHFSAAGIPAFLYGPRGGGIHGDDEWVSLRSLENQYAIYRELFKAA